MHHEVFIQPDDGRGHIETLTLDDAGELNAQLKGQPVFIDDVARYLGIADPRVAVGVPPVVLRCERGEHGVSTVGFIGDVVEHTVVAHDDSAAAKDRTAAVQAVQVGARRHIALKGAQRDRGAKTTGADVQCSALTGRHVHSVGHVAREARRLHIQATGTGVREEYRATRATHSRVRGDNARLDAQRGVPAGADRATGIGRRRGIGRAGVHRQDARVDREAVQRSVGASSHEHGAAAEAVLTCVSIAKGDPAERQGDVARQQRIEIDQSAGRGVRFDWANHHIRRIFRQADDVQDSRANGRPHLQRSSKHRSDRDRGLATFQTIGSRRKPDRVDGVPCIRGKNRFSQADEPIVPGGAFQGGETRDVAVDPIGLNAHDDFVGHGWCR